MPKEPSKPAPKSAVPKRAPKRRRPVVKVQPRTVRERIRSLLGSPAFGWGLLIALGFFLVAGVISVWAREQPLIATGQVMDHTRLVRHAFTTIDPAATERAREDARNRTPRVYVERRAALDALRQSLQTLPQAVADAATPEDVDPEIRRRFRLDADSLAALREVSASEQSTTEWRERVRSLLDVLGRRPLLDNQSWQRATSTGLAPRIKLVSESGERLVAKADALNIDGAEFENEVRTIVRVSGFQGRTADVVASALLVEKQPTFAFDPSATAEAADAAAEAVAPVSTAFAEGQVIYRRGDVLEPAQLALFKREGREHRAQAGWARLWASRAGVFGAVFVMTVLLSGYIGLFCPQIAKRPPRMAWLAGVVLLALAAAALGTAAEPDFLMITAVVPVVLVAVLVTIAYDQRTAVAVSAINALLVAVATGQRSAVFLVLLTGCGAAISQIREVRDRRTLVRMSLATGAALAVGAVFLGALGRPITAPSPWPSISQTLRDAALAGCSGLLVGGITLFILPTVEKLFGITTGMTLIELRDHKNPLLREMQQRAPGTYNHSLNVASIAEAAAEAIGADSLLTYVGCLYHDIGKINKPEYFVENQSGGPNKHDKLSPAMSLLVIVGHVKDGMEMAREYNLPRSLRHFIEAHHGTTLVEYFYHRARKQARTVSDAGSVEASTGELPTELDDERLPEEVDYRYPGPKPRTKEVAIVMIADAVESATRTLPEPTPSRIDALVRELADRRLADGQFDECDLTLRELHTACESISKTVASIYHGRISYPGDKAKKVPAETQTGPRREDGGDGTAEKSA